MRCDTRHLLRPSDPTERDDRPTAPTPTGDRERRGATERQASDRANPLDPLEIIAPGRPLPDVLNALCHYLETVAAQWERRDAALRRSEAFLAQAQRLTKTGSLWWKPATGEIAWSDENYRLMGYPIGITPTVELAIDRCHPDDRVLVQEKLGEAVRGGSPVDFEHRLLLPGDVVRHVRVRWDNVGSAESPEFIGAATDITEWKEAEERLRRSEAHLAQAQRLSATGNFGWSVDGEHLVWSEETYRIFGYDRSVSITRQAILDRVHPDDVEAVRDLIGQAEEGQAIDHEWRLLMPDGEVRHVHVVAQGARDRDGRMVIAGVLQDVTRQRVSEETLGSLRSELARVARAASIGALTASIAHEVNQPLAGVVSNASTCLRMLASETPNLEGARETARRAIRDAMRAADVITRLRALLLRKPPTTEPVDLNEATREVVALSRSELQRGRTTLRLELAERLSLVLGDRVQLQQVLINLLRNAIEAMSDVADRPREIVIRTHHESDGRVVLSVRDTGVGIAADSADRLFEAFYTTKFEGMGMGLSVSRSIIESLGGRLWAVPNDGAGATFALSIPRHVERPSGA